MRRALSDVLLHLLPAPAGGQYVSVMSGGEVAAVLANQVLGALRNVLLRLPSAPAAMDSMNDLPGFNAQASRAVWSERQGRRALLTTSFAARARVFAYLSACSTPGAAKHVVAATLGRGDNSCRRF